MNILVIGSGGREHALCWKIAQSKKVENLFVAPGNPGTQNIAQNVVLNSNDFNAVIAFIVDHKIDHVVVGPEQPLVDGIHDAIAAHPSTASVNVIGPKKAAAELEGSKDFAKEFMFRNNIPTAQYKTFTEETLDEGYTFLETLNAPYVLKADGLAAGKGVLILSDLSEAKAELQSMLVDSKFGGAGSKVVIEEFLAGLEFSVFAITDGEHFALLPEAKDYKRIGEGDTGLNTGGMGAVSPVPFVNDEMREKVLERIVKPTIAGFKKEKLDYKGFVFFGLIEVQGEPFVIEYNVRMGDPETEVVLPRLKTDLVDLIEACGNGTLQNIDIEFEEETAVTVMTVSGGYPGSYPKGHVITGLENVKNALVFHAGTKQEKENVVTNGGRVLAFTAYGEDMDHALSKAYHAIDKVDFEEMYFRKDIGFDL